ncbi:hypothetical protein CDIK_4111 [Cucumispora dikerogammari]|nr:hypothetical protein CDIK_4111 [Cucumispora dikerogammari]
MFLTSFFFLSKQILSCHKNQVNSQIKQIALNAEDAKKLVFDDPYFYASTSAMLNEINTLLQKVDQPKLNELKKTQENCQSKDAFELYFERTSVITKDINFITRLMVEFRHMILLKQSSSFIYKNIIDLPPLSEETKEKYLKQCATIIFFKKSALNFIKEKVNTSQDHYQQDIGFDHEVMGNIEHWYDYHADYLNEKADVIEEALNNAIYIWNKKKLRMVTLDSTN